MRKSKFHLFGFVLLLLSACSDNGGKTKSASQHSDTLHLWVDSSLSVLVNEERKSFENIYAGSRILIENRNEADIMAALFNNTVSAAVIHRKLSDSELEYLKKAEDFLPKQYVLAYDAYVFVAANSNPIQELDVDDIKNYFKNPVGKQFTISVENSGSQSAQFLKSHFGLNNAELKTVYATGNISNMMHYIRNTANSVALVPFSYIADVESETTAAFLKNIKVLPLTYTDSTGKRRSVLPSQETITTRDYPLISPIVLLNCNMQEKLGTTFVNFLYKQKAQRLILKFGLCPAIFPGREVRIKTN